MRRFAIRSTILPAALLALLPLAANAASPVGRYKTFDEDTGKPRLVVDVYEAKDGSYAARVVETLFAPNAQCTACKGQNKDQPIAGMVILWGLKPDGDNAFDSGTVLKLDNGKTYKSKAELTDGGRTLQVSGCVGFICKHQNWTRE
jgi:uncharacterized protein (DUF2147 family)